MKLVAKAEFWVDVAIRDPEGDETIIPMKFKHLRSTEFEALEVGANGEGIAKLVTDWDAEKAGEPFSVAAVLDAIDNIPWLPLSMFRSYASARRGYITKN